MKPIVALAVSNDAIRAAVIANPYTKRPTVRRIVTEQLPVGAVTDGEVVDDKTVTGLLRSLVSHGRLPRSDVSLVYASRRMIYREAAFPEMALAELRETLPFQAKNIIPLPMEDTTLDFVPLTREELPDGARLHGIVVATLRAGLERTAHSVESAGFKVASIDAGAFCLARVFADETGAQPIAVINVGSNSTDVIILSHGRPVYLRSVPSGGDDVTDAIVGALQIPEEDAAEIKQRIGLRNVTGDERLEKAEEAIRDTTAQLIVGIRNTLNYYGTENAQAPIAGILLTGAGSMLAGFPDVLGVSTSLTVRIGDPFARFDLSRDAAQQNVAIQAPAYAAVLGLALGRRPR